MENYTGIVSYSIKEYGRVRVKLKEALDSRGITRNKLRTLTGVKYDVIDRYYRSNVIQMVDLDFLAKVCCVLGCKITDLLEYENEEDSHSGNRG
ncbi:MAG: helix-turn-helix transcriptional regulator [Clostridiales bacterium]|nr:helix-turn-helix transcriptional regulator [Clostridiales bacterium]